LDKITFVACGAAIIMAIFTGDLAAGCFALVGLLQTSRLIGTEIEH
jgi:hypothetical protein